MPEMEHYRYDRSLTSTMVQDFLHDPILAAKVLLGIRVPPSQELRILTMWFHHYTQDDSGFSTGKSTTLAIVAALRSMLMEGRIGGMLSGTFRQGQLIFANFDRWYSQSAIFRYCVKHTNGKPRINHGNSAWEIRFKGDSLVRVLPPNFMQDSVRLQSERWHDAYLDEWPSFNMDSLTKTIFGRVTAVNLYQECLIRQNHIHLCGTPGFKHKPAYKQVKRVDANIARGNKDYARYSCNWRHFPRTDEWKGFIDYKIIYTMQTSNPEGVVKSEIDGFWQDDAMSYYSIVAIDDARSSMSCCLEKRQSPAEYFFCGFDTARGNARNTGKSKRTGWNTGGDDFSLSVLRGTSPKDPATHVLTERKNNITAGYAAGIIQEMQQQFHFTYIVFDPGGGGLFVRDELRHTECHVRGKLVRVVPIIEFDDITGTLGDTILIPFRRGAYQLEQMWGKMQSDSIMLNRAHQNMTNVIQNRGIILPPQWAGWDHNGSHWDVDAKRDWLNKAKGLTDLERHMAEMDLAICQLAMVDVKRQEGGEPETDSYGMFKFKSKSKKDSAYGLLYAETAFEIWKHGAGNGSGKKGGTMGFSKSRV